jgi:hypothetical protein
MELVGSQTQEVIRMLLSNYGLALPCKANGYKEAIRKLGMYTYYEQDSA